MVGEGCLIILLAVWATLSTVRHPDGLLVGASHVLAGNYTGAHTWLSDESFSTPMAAKVVDVLSDAHCAEFEDELLKSKTLRTQ
jgi:hypothetical protein